MNNTNNKYYYYDDALKASYMAREFGMKLDYDCRSHRKKGIKTYQTILRHLVAPQYHGMTPDVYYVAQESLHILESRDGDLFSDREIIQREGKAFFEPKVGE